MDHVLDRLFLELAHVVSPETKTHRELQLEEQYRDLYEARAAGTTLDQQASDRIAALEADVERLKELLVGEGSLIRQVRAAAARAHRPEGATILDFYEVWLRQAKDALVAEQARSARLAEALQTVVKHGAPVTSVLGTPLIDRATPLHDVARKALAADAPTGRYVTPEQVEAARLLLAFVESDDRLASGAPRRTQGSVAWDTDAIRQACVTLAPLLPTPEPTP